MEKLHSYQGFGGRLHEWRDNVKAKIANWREDHEGENIIDLTKSIAQGRDGGVADKEDYSHIYRSGTVSSNIGSAVKVQKGIWKINKYCSA